MLSIQRAMGWPGPIFLPCLTGQPGTQKGPQARAWAVGQTRRPGRHGPQGTTCPLGPLWNVPCRPGVVPCRAGPARCPGIMSRERPCCFSFSLFIFFCVSPFFCIHFFCFFFTFSFFHLIVYLFFSFYVFLFFPFFSTCVSFHCFLLIQNFNTLRSNLCYFSYKD